MLCDPDKRLTAEEVLSHTWVNNLAPNSQEVLLSLNVDALSNYRNFNKLKKATLTFIASRLKDEEIKNLKDIFTTLDKNQDGTLTVEEVKAGVSQIEGGDSINVDEIFKSIDTDGSGVINYTEFLAATIDQKTYLKEDRLYEAFRAFDKDNSGKISLDEIRHILQEGSETDNLQNLISNFDINGDGEIDYNEFISMMSKVEI